MYFVTKYMFNFVTELFRRLYYYWFPIKKKETVEVTPWEPSLQTIDLFRGKRRDFYKTYRTRPRLRHVVGDSVYNTSRRGRLHLKTSLGLGDRAASEYGLSSSAGKSQD